MPISPSVSNIAAQVVITGKAEDGRRVALEDDVLRKMEELGVELDEAKRAVERAVESKIVSRTNTGTHLVVGR